MGQTPPTQYKLGDNVFEFSVSFYIQFHFTASNSCCCCVSHCFHLSLSLSVLFCVLGSPDWCEWCEVICIIECGLIDMYTDGWRQTNCGSENCNTSRNKTQTTQERERESVDVWQHEAHRFSLLIDMSHFILFPSPCYISLFHPLLSLYMCIGD
jgi:hypothetical protein